MSSVVTQQLLDGLKDLFEREELSDKTLHIVEVDDHSSYSSSVFELGEKFSSYTRNSTIVEPENDNVENSNNEFEISKEYEKKNIDEKRDTVLKCISTSFSEEKNIDSLELNNPLSVADDESTSSISISDVKKDEMTSNDEYQNSSEVTKLTDFECDNSPIPTDEEKTKRFTRYSNRLKRKIDKSETFEDDSEKSEKSNKMCIEQELDEDIGKTDSFVIENNDNNKANEMVTQQMMDNSTNKTFIEVKSYCSIPVHSIVLSLNSQYFKNLFSASGMRETYEKDITIQVTIGEGRFLKILINAFYDQSVLTSLKTFDLLRVLDIADRFSCEVFISRCIELLKDAKLGSYNECNKIVDHLNKLENCGNLIKTKLSDMKLCCISYMGNTFCPLENKQKEHENFLNLSYESLILLLKSQRSIAWSENSLLVFIAHWIDYDEKRQKSEIIESLLKEINHIKISAEFLYDAITPNHPLFSIWPDYSTWFLDVISFHAFSAARNCMSNVPKVDRDFISNKMLPGWLLKFEQMGPLSFVATEECLSTYCGYQIRPRLFFKKDSQDKCKISLQFVINGITDTHTILHREFYKTIPMAIAILPGFEKYNSGIFSSRNAKFLYDHFRTLEVGFCSRTDYCSFEIGVIETRLIDMCTSFFVALAFKGNDWPDFTYKILPLKHHNLNLTARKIYAQRYR